MEELTYLIVHIFFSFSTNVWLLKVKALFSLGSICSNLIGLGVFSKQDPVFVALEWISGRGVHCCIQPDHP